MLVHLILGIFKEKLNLNCVFSQGLEDVFHLIQIEGKNNKWRAFANNVILASVYEIWLERNKTTYNGLENHADDIWDRITYWAVL